MNYSKLKEALKPTIAGYFNFGIDDNCQMFCEECALDQNTIIEEVRSTIGFEPEDSFFCDNCSTDINEAHLA
tara:strand:+ start:551 stop:766 length:216 start_codon:yes stop_codon:yes gene_type:complete